MPTSKTLKETIAPATSGYATKFTGVANGWVLVLIAIPIAIGIALLLLVLIRCCAGCFVYGLIALSVIALVAAGIYVWTQPVGGTVG